MSTYLLFVGIGNFAEVQSPGDDDTRVIVASRPEVSDSCGFTLEIAQRALKASADYYTVPYPLQKLHIIALTEYSGAMENWGAITASEIVSILDEKKSTLFDRQRAALVIIHEIEHQWFGDLVTMKWWNDIWLNESFATYMSHKILDIIRPDWELWSFFVTRYVFDAKKVDALLSTHPIEMQLRNPSEMNEAFDFISYNKGASILRMVEEYIGNKEFRRGIGQYIRSFSYANASSEDLWKILEESSSQPVSQIMKFWIRQLGYPLISVSSSNGKLIFEQSRFLISSGKESSPEIKPWPIPMIIELNGKAIKFLFSEARHEIDIQEDLSNIVVNVGQSGFYCVEYDRHMYNLLEKEFHRMRSLDRAGLLNDLSQLFIAGKIESGSFYKFVRLCFIEEEYSIVYSLWRELELFSGIAENCNSLGEVNLGFLRAQMKRIGLEPTNNESPNDGILREFVSCQLAKKDIIFAEMMANKFGDYEKLVPEIRSAVAVGYVRTGGSKAFNDLIDRLKKTNAENDREKLYLGLSSSEEPELIQELLDLPSKGSVPRSDIFWILYHSSRNPAARRMVWNWIKLNFDRLWDLLGSTLFVINLLDYALPRCAIEDEEDAKFFFSGERLKKAEMSFRRQLELLHVYASLRRRLSA
jgi:tricorn protease interacting factor F2/3